MKSEGATTVPTGEKAAAAGDARGNGGVVTIAGIGASAGGLEALEQLFRHMPADSGVAFVVIQHLSPDYKSLMVELLSKHTDMQVLRAGNNQRVLPDTVYLIPPKKIMTIFNGCLQLREKDPDIPVNLPIDIFFTSLAQDQGDRAVGIVLSGTGSDGTRGVRAIKEAGGMIMVQEESSAKFDGMPRSAMATGVADFILPPSEIPVELVTYVRHRHGSDTGGGHRQLLTEEDTLSRIFQLVKNQTRIDFSQYKSSTVVRRIQRRLHVTHMESLAEYLTYLMQHPREVSQFCKEMLIGVTNFFRDPFAFQKLAEEVLPALLDNRRNDDPIRVWSSGCASGEEAYSLAILFAEALDKAGRSLEVKIFATDIDRDALEFAGTGIFPETIAADVSPERLKRFFTHANGKYRVTRQIREMVVFAPHNVTKDPPFTRIDLIACRNLLIYLKPVLQKKLFALFRFALKPGGTLLLGSSESVGDFANQFRTVDTRWKIYQLREGGKEGLVPTLSMETGLQDNKKRLPRVQRFHRRPAHDEVLEMICRSLVETQNSSCIVVNEQHQLVYVFGDTQELVSFPTGQASLDILKLVPRALALALGTTLHRAAREESLIAYNGVVLQSGDSVQTVDIRVRRLTVARGQQTFYFILVQLADAPVAEARINATLDLQEQASQRVVDLEHDLQFTRENLQATIEELETSNEELQATNEELLSSNEELQSTNEELQSVNEELYTVNTEYQNKIQEMAELNNDIDNLLRCTDIGSIFLDKELCIRRFTPAVARHVNLIAKDVGRPLFDLSHRLDYPTFAEDARYVLETRESVSKEIETVAKEPVLVQIFPYLDEFNAGQGAVINFVDLSAIRNAGLKLMQMQKEKDVILDSISDVILYYNRSLEVVWANRAAFDSLGDKLIGTRAGQVWSGQEKGKPATGGAQLAMESGKPAVGAAEDHRGRCWQVRSLPVTEGDGRVRAVVELAAMMEASGGSTS
jgi:two-component system CheB/CheR fusion protein